MKASLSLLVLALLAVPASAAPATKPYADPTLGYALALPADWVVAPGMIMAATSPLEGPQDRYRETIKVVAADMQPGVTLATYVDGSLAAWKALWQVRERTAISLAGEPAVRLVLDQGAGQTKTRLLKTFVAHAGKIYVVTCAAEPSGFTRHLPAFTAATSSLAFTAIQAPTGPQALTLSGGSLSLPPTWKRAMPTVFLREVAGRRGTVMVSVEPGTTHMMLEAIRSFYKGGAMGRIVSDGPGTLGGAPAHQLVIVDGEGDEGDTRIRLFAERQGRVVELTFQIDTAGPAPAELTADLAAIAESWKWE